MNGRKKVSMRFDMKHHLRCYRGLLIGISCLLLVPVGIVTAYNGLNEGLGLLLFFLVFPETPLIIFVINRFSRVKAAFASEVLSGRLRGINSREPRSTLRSDSGELYHICGFYNLHPMFRDPCRFVHYKRSAWVVEIDTVKKIS